MTKTKVYVACPYTKGDMGVNVKNSIDVTEDLIEAGFIPFNPLYSHFQHMAHPRPYDHWLAIDLEWINVCDCVLRLPGESTGADIETNYANENNIPVYYSINELIYEKRNPHQPV